MTASFKTGTSLENSLVLLTELICWSRSTMDLFHMLNDLQSWEIGLMTQAGLQFDKSTSQGSKLLH